MNNWNCVSFPWTPSHLTLDSAFMWFEALSQISYLNQTNFFCRLEKNLCRLKICIVVYCILIPVNLIMINYNTYQSNILIKTESKINAIKKKKDERKHSNPFKRQQHTWTYSCSKIALSPNTFKNKFLTVPFQKILDKNKKRSLVIVAQKTSLNKILKYWKSIIIFKYQ